MLIRDATSDDLARIFEIYDREVLHGTATFETQPRTPAQQLEWFALHDRVRYPVLVAEVEEAVAGWARLYPWSPRPAYARTAENAVYVDPAFRGRGIGKLLLHRLIGRCPSVGIAVLVARVGDSNAASVALHESVGFKTFGIMRRVGEKFGRVLDVRMMDLHLDDPATLPAP